MDKKINIRPTTGVYATYKNYRYEPWTAFGEFIDNSTQSFFDHKRDLSVEKNFSLEIKINYHKGQTKNDDWIEISDNAYGMEIEDFKRAIILDSKPKKIIKNSRNEFGMGLKTAASWFGNKWTVISTKLGSDNQYSATVDVEKLSRTSEEFVSLNIKKVDKYSHGTTIIITNLNKHIVGGRTIGKIIGYLQNLYKIDIKNGVQIIYDGRLLEYKPIENFVDAQGKEWKKEINFDVIHKDQKLHVNGFVAIRKVGSTKDAGLVLLRRNRVIYAGGENTYRPHEIFGNPNDFQYQRVYGELNMDNWPVTQAKDNFDWNDEDLETKFIEELQRQTEDIVYKSKKIRKKAELVDKNLAFSEAINDLSKVPSFYGTKSIENTSVQVIENENELFDESLNEDKNVFLQTQKDIFYKGVTYKLVFEEKTSDDSWIVIQNSGEKNVQKIFLNINHPFFSSIQSSTSDLKTLYLLVISLVIAELSLKTDERGMVTKSDIRIKLNEILSEISQNK